MATRKPVIGPRRPSYHRKTGKGSPWEILVLNPHKTTGNPYEQHADDSREACVAWAENRRAELERGVINAKGGATVGQLLDAWLAEVGDNPDRRPRSWIAYRTHVNGIPQRIKDTLAHELTPAMVVKYRSALSKTNAYNTVKQRLNVLAMALDYGIRNDEVAGGPLKGRANVCKRPYLPRLKRPKEVAPKACPRADREAIRAELCGPHRIVVDLCYGAGLRFAEARAIGPRHLNVATRELRGVEQWNDYAGDQGATREPGFAPVKSVHGEGRTIPIPAWLVEALLTSERLYGLSDHGTYAHARTTSAVLEDRGWGKALKAARERAGITEEWTAHSFRHAFASEHLANGNDIARVAAWMGDTAETVWRTYVHPTSQAAPVAELPAPPTRPVRRESVGKRHLKVA